MESETRLNKSHDFPGTLICVEGIDGSGKSTQAVILRDRLKSLGYDVIFTEWNSSNLISQTTKMAKKQNLLSPRTFSLLHAVDFADRLEKIIIPALKAGFIVIADRYVYTAFARDVARGVGRDWVRKVYSFAVKPDLTLYFRVSEEVSLERICANRAPKFYEAGMDLKISSDPYESYKVFQKRVNDEYKMMVEEYGLIEVDGEESIHKKQLFFREKVKSVLAKKRNEFLNGII